MNILIFIFLTSLFSQDIISTKQFNVYVSNYDNNIDISLIITDMLGQYKIEGVKISDLQWNNNNKVYYSKNNSVLEETQRCELRFSITSSYNNDTMFWESCDQKDSFIGELFVDHIDSYLQINRNDYSHLSFNVTFWITGLFSNEISNNDSNLNDGILREWHKNGNLFIEYNYVKGKRDGIQKRWYENGKPEIIYNFHKGKLHGEQKRWHNNGQLKSMMQYKNDKLDGLSKEWYKNGQLKFIKLYINDTLDNILESYDSDGTHSY